MQEIYTNPDNNQVLFNATGVAFKSINFVTENLLAYYDAANTNSYLGSGNDWYDLTENSNDGTLNGPVFNRNTGGVINFDGIDDYVTLPLITSNITNVTLQCWVNVKLNKKGPFIRMGNGLNNGYAIGIGDETNLDFDKNGNNIIGLFPGIRWIHTGQQYSAGWQLVTMILDGSSIPSIYINDNFIGSYSGASPGTPTTNSYLGRCIGDEPVENRVIDADLSIVLIYDKALSPVEVSRNFNESKSRYL